MLTREDVVAARRRIGPYTLRTPLLRAGSPAEPVWLKLEYLQRTGVFKARGAFNRILSAKERGDLDPTVGIVAASGGNAGLANAYAARELGVPANVFVPTTAPVVKVERLREYGATVQQVGSEYAEAYTAAIDHAQETGAVFCHAYDQLEIAAGAGTLAEEILEDEPSIDTIVVAVGGGGLFAGITAAVQGRARIVAVEPTTIPTLHAALAAGRRVEVPVAGIAADSLGARQIGEIAFDVASRVPPISVLVDDEAIIAARRDLWEEFRIPAEYGAAAAWAALRSGAYRPQPGERVAVIVCGGNTDARTLETPRPH